MKVMMIQYLFKSKSEGGKAQQASNEKRKRIKPFTYPSPQSSERDSFGNATKCLTTKRNGLVLT